MESYHGKKMTKVDPHMIDSQPNNPLHAITLKAILEYLVAEY